MICLSVYFIYSATGGPNSIPGFNDRYWWQYLIALVPLIIGSIVFIVCESETLLLSKKQNQIMILKYEMFQLNRKRLFCVTSQRICRLFEEISTITVTKKDEERTVQIIFRNTQQTVLHRNQFQNLLKLSHPRMCFVFVYHGVPLRDQKRI